MSYYVEVTVKNKFESRDDAEAFADKVLESTKGAEYSRKITYLNPQSTYTSYVINNNFSPEATVQERITKAAQLGLLR